MSEQPAIQYAELLRQLRAERGLTQEELAAAAGISPRTVSDLERGINQTPRRATAELLADALDLTGDEREQFMAAARRRPAAPTGADGDRGRPTASRPAPAPARRAETDGPEDDAGASNVVLDRVGRQRGVRRPRGGARPFCGRRGRARRRAAGC